MINKAPMQNRHRYPNVLHLLLSGVILSLLAHRSSASPPSIQVFQPRPRLVVVVVIDQFRAEYLTRYQQHFGEGGFKWLMRRGANMTQARYTHGTTYTGPGHALLLSGTYGHTSGIIGNRWFNRATNRIESMFFDPDSRILGLEAVPKDDDTSPRNFIGTNLSDQLRLSNNFRSRVIGIANKDRAAIMLAGKLGKAYWYHEGAGGITSSSHYMAELPAWVQQFNARGLPASYYGKVWQKLLPEAVYGISRPDDYAGETDFRSLGRTFPHRLIDKSGKPTAEYFEAFTATPWSTDYQLELARLAITNERLGQDEDPDILGISLTAPDIAGHAFGPESHEVQDILLRLDRQLAVFLSELNRRFKPGELALVLTSDHGACPIPEYTASVGIDAGRIKKKQFSDAIEAALSGRYGAPEGEAKWVTALEDPGIFLNPAVIGQKKLDAAEVQRVAGEATLSIKGVAAYFTRAQFLSGQLPPHRLAPFFEKSFHPERSGDILIATRPYYFWGSYGERDTGSTHGSPYEYDTHVPMILWGSRVRPGQYQTPVDMADLAPTLAAMLGISAPAGNEGRCLHEILG